MTTRLNRPRGWAAAAFLAAIGVAPLWAETVRNHFDTDAAGRPPGFFDLVVIGSAAPAHWIVLADLNPPSAPNRLVQAEPKRPDDSIAAAVRRSYVFQDGKVTTFVKTGGGKSGLILRMADEKNFLVLFVDTVSGETVLSSYRDGKAMELGRARAGLDRGWEQFGVVAQGPALTVLFDDKPLFEAKDPKPLTGKTGLASVGPGEASFDEFVFDFSAPATP
jgi:hypothetical protein